jgi:hypothetical protein
MVRFRKVLGSQNAELTFPRLALRDDGHVTTYHFLSRHRGARGHRQ